jgi:hypothetical protein
MPLLVAFALLLVFPMIVSAQSGSVLDFGDTTFSNFGGVSGTSQQSGNMEFYNFSNGQSATRQNFGNTGFYCSPSPGLSGAIQFSRYRHDANHQLSATRSCT